MNDGLNESYKKKKHLKLFLDAEIKPGRPILRLSRNEVHCRKEAVFTFKIIRSYWNILIFGWPA